jgi:uncharacterized protein VirK/YbjX
MRSDPDQSVTTVRYETSAHSLSAPAPSLSARLFRILVGLSYHRGVIPAQAVVEELKRICAPKDRQSGFGAANLHPTLEGYLAHTADKGRELPHFFRARSREIHPSENRMGRIDVLKRLLHAVRFSQQDAKSIWPRRRLARDFVNSAVRCALHFERFRDWFGNPANPALQETLALRPSLITCVIRPYVNSDWQPEDRLEKINEHYRMLSGALGILRFVSDSIALADAGEGVQIRLDRPVTHEHEGELTISLFRGDLRLYSLMFTLGRIGLDRVAYAGGLQGLNSSLNATVIYRSLTHRMHGLRPRDLLITAFRTLCCCLGVVRILAISDRKRVCTNPYFLSSTKVFSSYDSAWIESGGVAVDDAFFELSPHVVRRTAMEIPSRKRAQYRRRYAMLNSVAQQIGAAVRAPAAAEPSPHCQTMLLRNRPITHGSSPQC